MMTVCWHSEEVFGKLMLIEDVHKNQRASQIYAIAEAFVPFIMK